MILSRKTNRILFLLGVALWLLPWFTDSVSSTLSRMDPNRFASQDRSIHLLIPVTSATPNFCRTALTAALLDYPTPILINWGGNEDPQNRFASHLAKIDSTLKYLRGLPQRNDQDLVLIVDGHDIWFQLRPEVLIQRYHMIVAHKNEMLMAEFDSETIRQHDIKQSVLFGADKKCWPQDQNSATCNVIPASSLPKNIFGKQTDNIGKHRYARPRWLNSGTILGPAAEVRAIFEAASLQLQSQFHGYSDQWYFAELLRDQELWRNSLSKSPRDFAKFMPKDDQFHSVPASDKNTNPEFHIAVDYESSLFHTNAFAADDSQWIEFNHTGRPSSNGNGLGRMAAKKPSLILPEDISHSRSPISKELVADELYEEEPKFTELPFNTTWGDVPLLWNKVSDSVPVIIHMNGDKKLLNEWWGRLWWAKGKWGEHLLRSSSRASRGPLGSTFDPETSKVTTWYKGSYNSLRRENSGYWTSGGHWLYYNDVCGRWTEILYHERPAKLQKPKGDYMGPARKQKSGLS